MSQQVSLEILEPRGVLSDPKREGLFAPRLSDLNGRTIALMGINIPVFHTSVSDVRIVFCANFTSSSSEKGPACVPSTAR